MDLYAELKGGPGNLFFSPFSISTCLAMAYAGTRGETEAQMSRVLHFGRDQAQFHGSFGEILRQLREMDIPLVLKRLPGMKDAGCRPQFEPVPGLQLDMANALWAQAGQGFREEFLQIAATAYQAHIKHADFWHSLDAAFAKINDWVAEKTHDKIQNILPPQDRPDDPAGLVLVNAIYFKGDWSTPFEKAATATKPFFLSTREKVDVPLMYRAGDFRYMGNEEFQALELPYIGERLAMAILLPRKIDGCGHLESRLNASFLHEMLMQMRSQIVEVYLPRFNLESEFRLRDVLRKMGLTDAFAGGVANFAGMDGEPENLFISDIFHKAWGEVNEEGTEAAAATCAPAVCLAIEEPTPQPVFRADHPFIFLIRDTRTGSVLFLGRLADPRE